MQQTQSYLCFCPPWCWGSRTWASAPAAPPPVVKCNCVHAIMYTGTLLQIVYERRSLVMKEDHTNTKMDTKARIKLDTHTNIKQSKSNPKTQQHYNTKLTLILANPNGPLRTSPTIVRCAKSKFCTTSATSVRARLNCACRDSIRVVRRTLRRPEDLGSSSEARRCCTCDRVCVVCSV